MALDEHGEARERPWLDATLTPHRSLGRTGFIVVMALISAVSFTAGIAFLIAGAWPVFGFFGLDVLLIYAAFKLNYADARAVETVRVGREEVVVRVRGPRGGGSEWRAPAHWTRVELDDHANIESRLALACHGRRLYFGGFLTPEERRALAAALEAALARARGR